MRNGMMWLCVALIWMSTAAAVIFAIYWTDTLVALWTFILPASISFKQTDKRTELK